MRLSASPSPVSSEGQPAKDRQDTSRRDEQTSASAEGEKASSLCFWLVFLFIVIVLVGVVLVVWWISYVLPENLQHYYEIMAKSPVLFTFHTTVEALSGYRIDGPRAFESRQRLDVWKRLQARDDAIFEHLLRDATFTRFEKSRIFFRPARLRNKEARAMLPEKGESTVKMPTTVTATPLSGSASFTWGMAELAHNTTLNASSPSVQNLACVSPHSIVKYVSTYFNAVGAVVRSTVLNPDHFATYPYKLPTPCEHHVALLMCAGDVWDVACPPEAQQHTGGDPGHPLGWGQPSTTPHPRAYVFVRFEVEAIQPPVIGNYTDVAEELAYRVLEAGGPSGSSQETPFRRVDMYRKLQNNPYKRPFAELS